MSLAVWHATSTESYLVKVLDLQDTCAIVEHDDENDGLVEVMVMREELTLLNDSYPKDTRQ